MTIFIKQLLKEPSAWSIYISQLIYSPMAIYHLLLVVLCYVINTKAVALRVHCKKNTPLKQ